MIKVLYLRQEMRKRTGNAIEMRKRTGNAMRKERKRTGNAILKNLS